MKTLIVEDSRLARNELKTLLKEHPELEIIGEAANGQEGLEMIQSLGPDLVFLDIQMPGMNGFEMLEALDEVPIIIFTTAYDQYAIKSFEYNALDYLLKPVHPDRLSTAIGKAQEKNQPKQGNRKAQFLGPESKVFVKDGERCWMVRLADVKLMEVNGNYTKIYFEGNKPLIYRSLNYMETRLDPKSFFRANRQQIINIESIAEINPWFNGKLKIKLKEIEQEIEVSRRQAAKFKDLLSF